MTLNPEFVQLAQRQLLAIVVVDGHVSAQDVDRIANAFAFKVDTVRRWARKAERRELSVEGDTRAVPFDHEWLGVIAHFGQLRAAWELLRSDGKYSKGYVSFTREFRRLPADVCAGVLRGRKSQIAHTLVMAYPPVARNEVWALDSTQSDVHVLPPRGGRPIRPWLSIVVDRATDAVVSAVVNEGPPNAPSILAMFVEAIIGDRQGETFIGGTPDLAVMDNGAENLSNDLATLLVRLAIVMRPTVPRSPWQNGTAENALKQLQTRHEHQLAGYIHGGKDHAGMPRFQPDAHSSPRPEGLLTFEQYRQHLQRWKREHNARRRRDGTCPLEKYAGDPAPIQLADLDDLRWAFLKSPRKQALVTYV